MIQTEIFMLITRMIYYATDKSAVPIFIMFCLTPILGGIITKNIAKRNKTVSFTNSFWIIFCVVNIVAYLIIYFINYRFNITLLVVYMIGALIGFIKAIKEMKKLKSAKIEDKESNIFVSGQEIKVKNYRLDKINEESIQKFLKTIRLKDSNYLLAQITPGFKNIVIYGNFLLFRHLQYIIYFTDEELYFFELYKIKKEDIKNAIIVKYKDIKVKKITKGWLFYKIKLKFENGKKVKIKIPKVLKNLYTQKLYGERLLEKLKEIKSNNNK